MLFDVRLHQWSEEILQRIELSGARMARPVASGTALTGIGLGRKVVMVAGGRDQACGAMGASALEPGPAVYATGTVECITPVMAQPVFTPALHRNNLCTYDHTVPGKYTAVAYSLTGGNLLSWYRNQFEPVRNFEEVVEGVARKASGLLVLPYWTASGTPYFDLKTPGVIGGGARSAFWTQLKADVVGRPITTSKVTEAGCLGAAIPACAAVTGQSLAELARRRVQRQQTVLPQAAGAYEERFTRYRELYPALRPISP